MILFLLPLILTTHKEVFEIFKVKRKTFKKTTYFWGVGEEGICPLAFKKNVTI